MTTLVIGAGPAGLAAGRALQEAGLAFEIVERHRDVGGIWDLDNPGTPMYESAHFISSKTLSGFTGFPMPEHYPDYPNRAQILDYIRAYADHTGLREHIGFDREVRTVEPAGGVAVPQGGGGWDVTFADGGTGHYDAVVVANGRQWIPNVPDIPGTFTGRLIHSREYTTIDELRGQRVLVVGGGNSGVDIACDAAVAADHAAISLRRGYWFVPKYIFGIPSDVFAHEGPQLPIGVQQWSFARMLNLLVGKPQKFGLPKPDHRLFETHPILNDQIFHFLGHGDLAVRPDVARFDGDRVEFRDGTREPFDVVILATGFHVAAPFLAPGLMSEPPDLFLQVANREHDGLYFVGIFEVAGAAYGLMGTQAALVAAMIRTERDGRRPALRRMRRERPDISGPVEHANSPRHAIYVDVDRYPEILDGYRQRLESL